MASIFVHKVREAAFFHDLAVIYNGQTVALLNCRQPMGDDNRCAVAHDRVEGLLHLPLRVLVKGACCLVEKQDAWLTNDSPSNGNSLLLTARELAATVSCEDFEAFVELLSQQRCVGPHVDQSSLLFELALLVVLLHESGERLLDLVELFSLYYLLGIVIHFQVSDQLILLLLHLHFRLSHHFRNAFTLSFSCRILSDFGPRNDRLIDLSQHLLFKLDESSLEHIVVVVEGSGQVIFAACCATFWGDKLEGVGLLGSLENLLVARVKPTVQDVLLQRVVEEQWLLLDEAKPLA